MKLDIAQMDYNDFERYPKTVRDIKILGKYHYAEISFSYHLYQ